MDNAGGPSRADQLDLMLTYEQHAHARTKAERDAAVARADQTNANYNILKDDYRDLLEDKHRAVARAEKAERANAQLSDGLSAMTTMRDAARAERDEWKAAATARSTEVATWIKARRAV